MQLQNIVAPIVGAIIGYSTNWLAIKMLFKPHNPIKIGKFTLPFTPGVIPREKERIAQSLGKAVGERLLTEDVILKELTNDQVIASLKHYIMDDLLSKPIILDKTAWTKDNQVFVSLADFIQAQMLSYLKDNPLLENSTKEYVEQWFKSEKKIGELLSESEKKLLHEMIEDKDMAVAQAIVLLMEEDENAAKIQQAIGGILEKKLGGLAAMFVDPVSLYATIVDYVRSSLDDESNRKELMIQINKVLDRFMEVKVCDLVNEDQSSQVSEAIVKKVSDTGLAMLSGEGAKDALLQLISGVAEKGFKIPDTIKPSVESIVEKFYIQFATNHLPVFIEQFNVSGIIEKEVHAFSTQEVEDLIFAIVDKELKAITWFGALLGLVMGTIMIFM